MAHRDLMHPQVARVSNSAARVPIRRHGSIAHRPRTLALACAGVAVTVVACLAGACQLPALVIPGEAGPVPSMGRRALGSAAGAALGLSAWGPLLGAQAEPWKMSSLTNYLPPPPPAPPPRLNWSLEEVRTELEAALKKDIWFVSGRVPKVLFASDFKFQDPDVRLDGIEAYGKGVASLFDQDLTKASVLDVIATGPKEIQVRWELAATVGLPPTLPFRLGTVELPKYVVTSTLKVNNFGLVDEQKDEFDRPTSELLKSATFKLR
mmetsp:Transcript_5956/g.11160  ORF Transcript_5956/g.11160 Transcript_5956/m.11160 type:complete len:265 (-) Transcript_5956:90-884(-)